MSDINQTIHELVQTLNQEIVKCERAERENEALREALREATEWNWLDENDPPPDNVVRQCEDALDADMQRSIEGRK